MCSLAKLMSDLVKTENSARGRNSMHCLPLLMNNFSLPKR